MIFLPRHPHLVRIEQQDPQFETILSQVPVPAVNTLPIAVGNRENARGGIVLKRDIQACHNQRDNRESYAEDLRTAAEIALKESEGRFRAIFDAAQDAIFI